MLIFDNVRNVFFFLHANNLETVVADVSNAYLNGLAKENIYTMEVPRIFNLYGLLNNTLIAHKYYPIIHNFLVKSVLELWRVSES